MVARRALGAARACALAALAALAACAVGVGGAGGLGVPGVLGPRPVRCAAIAAERAERHRALAAWLRARGGNGTRALAPDEAEEAAACGEGPLRATLALGEGTTVLEVPFSAVLSARSLASGSSALRRAAQGQPEWVALVLALLREVHLGEASEFAPYVDSLPEHAIDAAPFSWEAADAAELQASPVRARAEAQRRHLLEAHTAVVRSLTAEPTGANPLTGEMGSELGFGAFAWAAAIVWSRSFACPLDAGGDEQGASAADGSPVPCLVPLADALALAPEGGERGWESTADEGELEAGEAGEDSATFVFRVGQRVSYAPGDIVYADFGTRATAELLLATGEVILENPSDTFSLAAGDLAVAAGSSREAAIEKSLIAEQIAGASLSAPLVLQADGIRPEVLTLLRIATLDDELAAKGGNALEEVVTDIEELGADVDQSGAGSVEDAAAYLGTPHEERALKLLRRLCLLALGRYGTSLEADEVQLAQASAGGGAHKRSHSRAAPGTAAARRLAALKMRIAEKRILEATLEEVARALARLNPNRRTEL